MSALARTRRGLMVAAAAAFVAVVAVSANAQPRTEEPDQPAEGRQVDPVTGKVCRPMCAEDMSPCDPPVMKAREGRCSSPSAGFVG